VERLTNFESQYFPSFFLAVTAVHSLNYTVSAMEGLKFLMSAPSQSAVEDLFLEAYTNRNRPITKAEIKAVVEKFQISPNDAQEVRTHSSYYNVPPVIIITTHTFLHFLCYTSLSNRHICNFSCWNQCTVLSLRLCINQCRHNKL